MPSSSGGQLGLKLVETGIWVNYIRVSPIFKEIMLAHIGGEQ
jgi:hypothetical protein